MGRFLLMPTTSLPSDSRRHALAVLAMVAATLLWSMAGVVTRHLHQQDGMVLVFWRSAFAAIGVALYLLRSGAGPLLATLRGSGPLLWVSALSWGTMFTAFMLALSLTSVAQALIAESLGPLVAALLGLWVLGQRLPLRTWAAIALASLGMGWIVFHNLQSSFGQRQLLGLAIAMLVPLAAASNWVSLRRAGARVPMVPALMLGGALSALVVAWPALQHGIDGHDLFWLAFLGLFQLAAPGVFVVWAAQRLSPAEVSLLGLLEVVFGIAWTWLGAGEAPGPATLTGGGLILLALVGNEILARWRPART